MKARQTTFDVAGGDGRRPENRYQESSRTLGRQRFAEHRQPSGHRHRLGCRSLHGHRDISLLHVRRGLSSHLAATQVLPRRRTLCLTGSTDQVLCFGDLNLFHTEYPSVLPNACGRLTWKRAPTQCNEVIWIQTPADSSVTKQRSRDSDRTPLKLPVSQDNQRGQSGDHHETTNLQRTLNHRGPTVARPSSCMKNELPGLSVALRAVADIELAAEPASVSKFRPTVSRLQGLMSKLYLS